MSPGLTSGETSPSHHAFPENSAEVRWVGARSTRRTGSRERPGFKSEFWAHLQTRWECKIAYLAPSNGINLKHSISALKSCIPSHFIPDTHMRPLVILSLACGASALVPPARRQATLLKSAAVAEPLQVQAGADAVTAKDPLRVVIVGAGVGAPPPRATYVTTCRGTNVFNSLPRE